LLKSKEAIFEKKRRKRTDIFAILLVNVVTERNIVGVIVESDNSGALILWDWEAIL
jgi:hypothetical protein